MQTTQDIIDFFETLVTDTLDSVAVLVLINQADAIIRATRPWEILKSEDASKSRSSGDTFLTAKTLPTDFHRPYKFYVGDSQRRPLKRIKFEDRRKFKDSPGFYYIDYKTGNYYITNGTQEGTIYNNYIYKPVAITLSTTPVFPSDYWPIYAYCMSKIFMGGIDNDDRSLASVPEWISDKRELWDAMVTWDAELKENDLYQDQYQDSDPLPVDVGLW